MKKIIFLSIIFIIVFTPLYLFAKTNKVIQVEKFQITSDSHQENNPAIYKNHVVYADWGGGATGIDIRLYNLKTGEDKLLVEKSDLQMSPDIFGKIVVYIDYNGSDWDIYGLNLKTNQEFPIAVISGSNQVNPAIYRNIVVWSDNRDGNYDIYGYNLKTEQEFKITDDVINNHVPRVWDNKVVWYSHLGGGFYGIKGYDLKKNEFFAISSVNNGYQQTPDIYKNEVVWTDARSGQAKIYYKNLKTGEEKILTSTGGKSWPQIHKGYVTWVDNEGIGAHDIYAYDLKHNEVVQVSDDGSQQLSPTIPDMWGNTIVWMSWHTGNGDIYGARVK